MKKQLLFFVILTVTTITANAQLGGLLKKTKQHVTANEFAEINTNQEAVKNTAIEEHSAPQEQDGYNVSSNGISLYSNELKITFSTVPFNSGDVEPSKLFTTKNLLIKMNTTWLIVTA